MGVARPKATSLRSRLLPLFALSVLFILAFVVSNKYRSHITAESGWKIVNGVMQSGQSAVAKSQNPAQHSAVNPSDYSPASIELPSKQERSSNTGLESDPVLDRSNAATEHAKAGGFPSGPEGRVDGSDSRRFTNKETESEKSESRPTQKPKGKGHSKKMKQEELLTNVVSDGDGHADVASKAEESSNARLDPKPSLDNRCQTASASSPTAFFAHCRIPNRRGVKKLEAYVEKRLATYTGNPACLDELLEFHCLEFASRQKRWCDWKSAPFVDPASDKQFLVHPSGNFADGLVKPEDPEDQKLVFFYPSYAFLPSLERSIVSLQHPKHVFLVAVDAPEYADPEFVSGAKDLAIALNDRFHNNVFLFQGGRVLYETSTQILVAWPFMAWALEYVTGWTHFILTDAQTYPLVSNEELRKVLWERQDKVFFTKTPYEVSTGPDFEGDSRRYEEVLPLCEGDRDDRHVNYQQASAMGSWKDERGQVRDGYKRVDWLKARLGTGWEFGKTGGNMVIVPRDVVQFLVRSTEGKMWTQYFKYMVDACEHLIVSIVHHYFRDKAAQDYSSCFMLWGGGPENVLLSESDVEGIRSGSKRYLFARKFRVPESSDLLDKVDEDFRSEQ